MKTKEILTSHLPEVFPSALEYLSSYKKETEPLFEEFFRIKKTKARDFGSIQEEVIDKLASFCQKGKMLRGTLVMLGYETFGGEQRKAVLAPSVGYEILASAFLIHDDIMDRTKLRREEITFHNFYAQKKDLHYGESMALLIGNLAYILAGQLQTDLQNPIPEKWRNLATNHIYNIVENTLYGQISDINQTDLSYLTEEKVLETLKNKTAYYSCSGPLEVGAILAGKPLESLRPLEKYGLPIGLAFQIQDDILGIFGKEKTFGKPVDVDIKEGKVTLLAFYAFQNANEEQRKDLKKLYGNSKIGEGEAQIIRQIFKKTGAEEKAKTVAEKLVNEGKKAVSEITTNSYYQKIFNQIADFVVSRSK